MFQREENLKIEFKKKGMRWSKKGALSLGKVGQKIVNNEWNSWWPKEIAKART